MITKHKPQTVVHYYSMSSNRGNPELPQVVTRWHDTYYVNDQTISYEEGPKYIGAPRHCNWKQCMASSSGGRPDRVPTLSVHSYGHGTGEYSQLADEFHMYDIPWFNLSTFGLNSLAAQAPSAPSGSVSAVASEMWADIAGRTNDSFLMLEDVAGFLSGRSLIKGIWGVASAVQSLAKGVSATRKLARVFGYRKSLYQSWVDSKNLVREILGLHLGYRFSFKTTLNDVVQAVSFASSFMDYCRELTFRNASPMVKLTKTRVWRNAIEAPMTAAAANSAFLSLAPSRITNMKRYLTGDTPAYRAAVGETQIKMMAAVKVRYPSDYLTMRHYYSDRFGFDKPLTTLWAIVPMSFVIDYLVNVQDMMSYLDNKLRDAFVSASIYYAWLLTKTERYAEFKRAGYTNTVRTPGVQDPFIYTTTVPNIYGRVVANRSFSRIPYPVGSIRAALPPLINGENALHSTMTSLELLSQSRLR